jgi:hypothetical protein
VCPSPRSLDFAAAFLDELFLGVAMWMILRVNEANAMAW